MDTNKGSIDTVHDMNNEFTILLADSDDGFQERIATFLKNTGTRLVSCSSGKEAIASLQSQRPDLVLLTDSMKDITALSFCRKLKNDKKVAAIPMVMILSPASAGNQQSFFQAGCSDVLLKPVERVDFFTSLKKFVNLEKRFSPRIRSKSSFQCALRYSINHDCRVFDISSGGVFLESCPPLPINTMVSLNFALPETEIEIACKARVAWINHPIALSKIDFPVGVGLQFLEMSQKDAGILAAYLDSHRQGSDEDNTRQRLLN